MSSDKKTIKERLRYHTLADQSGNKLPSAQLAEDALAEIERLEKALVARDRHMAECPEGKERIRLEARVKELESLRSETGTRIVDVMAKALGEEQP